VLGCDGSQVHWLIYNIPTLLECFCPVVSLLFGANPVFFCSATEMVLLWRGYYLYNGTYVYVSLEMGIIGPIRNIKSTRVARAPTATATSIAESSWVDWERLPVSEWTINGGPTPRACSSIRVPKQGIKPNLTRPGHSFEPINKATWNQIIHRIQWT